MKLAILLTGTVRPAVSGGNFSIQERFEMYRGTLSFYAHTIGKKYPILFVENSDVDLTPWKQEFKDLLDLEIIQFSPADQSAYQGFDNSKGKGFNEYLMIKKAFGKSEILKNCTHFLKITGRYAMLNIQSMIHEAESRISKKEIVFMGDIKDTKIYEMLGIQTYSSHWGDSRFFVASASFYQKEMQDCYQEMDDSQDDSWAECYFLRLSRKFRQDSRFIFRWHHQVQFNGVSGTLTSEQLKSGVGSQDSWKYILKNKIRYILRILFPYIWF